MIQTTLHPALLESPPPQSPLATDELLMRRTQQGDREAFAELFRRYSAKLCTYLDRMGRWVDDVESVSQETFLQALRYAHTYRYPRKFADWFFTIARNLASRRRRAWSRGAIRNASDLDAEMMDRQPDLDRGGGAHVDLLQHREEMAIVRGAMEKLPDYQRAVIALGILEEKPYAQIEQLTGVKAVTLRSHMFKGLRRLTAMLQVNAES